MARISREYSNHCEKEVDTINGRCVRCAVRQTRQEKGSMASTDY